MLTPFTGLDPTSIQMLIVDVRIHVTIYILKNNLSINFNKEYVSIILTTIILTAADIYF